MTFTDSVVTKPGNFCSRLTPESNSMDPTAVAYAGLVKLTNRLALFVLGFWINRYERIELALATTKFVLLAAPERSVSPPDMPSCRLKAAVVTVSDQPACQ